MSNSAYLGNLGASFYACHHPWGHGGTLLTPCSISRFRIQIKRAIVNDAVTEVVSVPRDAIPAIIGKGGCVSIPRFHFPAQLPQY